MDDSVSSGRSRPSLWIVGYDGSENSRHAALWAATHADDRADELRLIISWHAPSSTSPRMPTRFPTGLADDVEAEAWDSVNELAESFRSTVKVPITTAAASGGPARSLLDAATTGGLIVVGSRGRGGFARLLLGSTSTQVATHATVPTAVIPPGAAIDRADRILVATDGSENSLAALDWAIDFAPPGAHVDCVKVWDVSPLAVGADQSLIADASSAARAKLEHIVETRQHLRSGEIELTERFVDGAARHELRRLAEGVDLFVMGARGHGTVGAVLLGSVSTWLLHHVDVPMVVVPASESDADGPSS